MATWHAGQAERPPPSTCPAAKAPLRGGGEARWQDRLMAAHKQLTPTIPAVQPAEERPPCCRPREVQCRQVAITRGNPGKGRESLDASNATNGCDSIPAPELPQCPRQCMLALCAGTFRRQVDQLLQGRCTCGVALLPREVNITLKVAHRAKVPDKRQEAPVKAIQQAHGQVPRDMGHVLQHRWQEAVERPGLADGPGGQLGVAKAVDTPRLLQKRGTKAPGSGRGLFTCRPRGQPPADEAHERGPSHPLQLQAQCQVQGRSTCCTLHAVGEPARQVQDIPRAKCHEAGRAPRVCRWGSWGQAAPEPLACKLPRAGAMCLQHQHGAGLRAVAGVVEARRGEACACTYGDTELSGE
mmetsp:Transcript_28553/g.91019  ORF Transcript_28553/g.91019 Transcript_28553/m.91019 type:complete len:355 (+) Transcript_28553:128-1192(+)